MESYAQNTREKEMIEFMLKLEIIAKEHGCKFSFWRRIQKVATQLELSKKIEEYDNEFQNALSKKHA